jgi:hypothetical protein
VIGGLPMYEHFGDEWTRQVKVFDLVWSHILSL